MDPAPRRSLRIPLPVEALRESDRAPRFLGYLGDISTTGGFVQCARPRAMGTILTLRMRLPGWNGPLEPVQAEVIWTRGYRGRQGPAPGMGVRFVQLARQTLAEIRQFCQGSDPSPYPVIEASEEPISVG